MNRHPGLGQHATEATTKRPPASTCGERAPSGPAREAATGAPSRAPQRGRIILLIGSLLCPLLLVGCASSHSGPDPVAGARPGPAARPPLGGEVRLLVTAPVPATDTTGVWALDPAGGPPRLLASDEHLGMPVYSAPARALVYVSRIDRRTSDLCVVHPFSGRPPVRTRIAGGRITGLSAAYHAPEVAYTFGRTDEQGSMYENHPTIYIQDIESGDTERLQWPGHPIYTVVWSPRGDQFALGARLDGRLQVALMSRDGTSTLWLTRGPLESLPIDWSPDGSMIAGETWSRRFHDISPHEQLIDLERGILICDVAKQECWNSWQPGKNDFGPIWSADGTGVFFCSDRGGHVQLCRLDIASREIARLGESPNEAWAPCPSPDGHTVFFVRAVDGKLEMRVGDRDGQSLRRIPQQPEGITEVVGTIVMPAAGDPTTTSTPTG